MNIPQNFIKQAIDSNDADWTFHHCMKTKDRDAFDRFLVEQHHPLAFRAGTQEYRFKTYMQSLNNFDRALFNTD